MTTRRELLATAGGAGLAALCGTVMAEDEARRPAHDKVFRVGVISARIKGKPQPTNGHTWHFAQYLHPTINMEGIRKYKDPANVRFFQEVARNPRDSFGILPFSNTEITHYYEADPEIAATLVEEQRTLEADLVGEIVRALDDVSRTIGTAADEVGIGLHPQHRVRLEVLVEVFDLPRAVAVAKRHLATDGVSGVEIVRIEVLNVLCK